MGKGAGVSREGTPSDQEAARGGLELPTDGQAARKWRAKGVKAKTIYGADAREVLKLLGASTSYVERTNLTSRHMNGRLVRKTLGYSKELAMLRASSIWEDAVYNLGRALKTLRTENPEAGKRRWRQRSPAMAAGLTDHIWEIEELLTTLPLPSTNTWSGDYPLAVSCIKPLLRGAKVASEPTHA